MSDAPALGWSADRADLIKFADGESDDYPAGRKEKEEEGKDDNENNCGELNTLLMIIIFITARPSLEAVFKSLKEEPITLLMSNNP